MECKLELNWRRPLFIILCLGSVFLIIASTSTRYWSKKDYKCDSREIVLHFGLFDGCLNTACWDLDYEKGTKVKSLLISACIIGIIAMILNVLKMRWNNKVKNFIVPVLMLVIGILVMSAIAVYGDILYYTYDVCKYMKGNAVDKHLVEDIDYGWSYVVGCIGGILSLLTFCFGLYTDFVDIFGSSESQFQSRRLDEVV